MKEVVALNGGKELLARLFLDRVMSEKINLESIELSTRTAMDAIFAAIPFDEGTC
jgi:hypothetical protein